MAQLQYATAAVWELLPSGPAPCGISHIWVEGPCGQGEKCSLFPCEHDLMSLLWEGILTSARFAFLHPNTTRAVWDWILGKHTDPTLLQDYINQDLLSVTGVLRALPCLV